MRPGVASISATAMIVPPLPSATARGVLNKAEGILKSGSFLDSFFILLLSVIVLKFQILVIILFVILIIYFFLSGAPIPVVINLTKLSFTYWFHPFTQSS